MNVSEVLAKDLNREIKVEVSRDNIEDKLLSKLGELKNTVQLKGFRPGKVPINHLRKVFGQRIMPEIIEDLVKETSAKAMSDRNERPAIQPKISFYQGKPSEDKEKEEIDAVSSEGEIIADKAKDDKVSDKKSEDSSDKIDESEKK